MVPDILTDALGLPALATLLLLPGLLVRSAPWTAVPFLSAAFWILSWWWLPTVGFGRDRVLRAALLVFLVLAVVRLRRPTPAERPTLPVVLVVAAALVRLVPFAFWPVAPGVDMSLHALSTRLLVEADGLPSSWEPLLPIAGFGAYPPGLHVLAADLARLAAIPPDRAAFLISVAAHGLTQVALYALLRRFFTAPVSALAAILALGLARVPQAFFGWGGNPSVLALAFLTAAASLLAPPTGRRAAAGAGVLLGAALVVHSMMAAVAVAALPLVVWRVTRPGAEGRREALVRYGIAGLTALAAAAPFLLRLDYPLSAEERGWLADHLRTRYADDWTGRYATFYPLAVLRFVLAMLNDAFLAVSLAGIVLAARWRTAGLRALGLTAVLLLAVVATARWGGLGPLVVFPERAVALLAIALAVGIAAAVRFLLDRRRRWAPRAVLLIMAGIAAERAHRYYFAAGHQVMVTSDDLAAMAFIRGATREGDLVCNDERTSGVWIPALAGRAISVPHLPPFYFDEFREGRSGRTCLLRYVSERWFFGPAAPRPHRGRVVFRSGGVRVLESGELAELQPEPGSAHR
jgi:hypothetical protein